MADLIFRGNVTNGDGTLAASSIVVPFVPNTRVGDLQTIWCATGVLAPASPPDFNTPSGWILKGSSGSFAVSGGALNAKLFLFERVCDGTDGAVTLSTVGSVNAAMTYSRSSRYNADNSNPIPQVSWISATGGPGTSAVVSGLTTGADRAYIEAFLAQGAAQSATPPGSMTERSDLAANGISTADELIATAGATGTRTFTLPGSADFLWGIAEIRSAPPAVTLLGPVLGRESVQSSDFVVGCDSPIVGTVVVTPSDGAAGGTFSPGTVSISSGSPTGLFRYTPPAGAATRTISVTNSGGLVNPASISFVVQAASEPQNPLNLFLDPRVRTANFTRGSTDPVSAVLEAWIFGTSSGGSVSKSDPDTGSASEAASIASTTSTGDSGAGTDTASLQASLSAADTAAASEAAAVAVTITAADSGAATEAPSVQAGLIATDTSAGFEAAAIASSSTVADTGAGTDTAALQASLSAADTAAASEAAAVAVTIAAADSASESETATIAVSVLPADSGTGSEAAAIAVSSTVGDGAAATDAAVVFVGITAAETAGATESAAVAVAVTAADTASGTSGASVQAGFTASDSAAGTETVAIAVSSTVADSGGATDTAQLLASISAADSATGTAAVAVVALVSAADSGAATDAAQTTVAVIGSDVGSGGDAVAIVAGLVVADAAAVLEAAEIVVTGQIFSGGFGFKAPARPFGGEAFDWPFGATAPDVPFGAEAPDWPFGFRAPGRPFGSEVH